jgi:hypothetical protein
MLKGSKSKESVAQFAAGKTDLAALRQEYPPLYAASALERKERSEESEPEPVGDQAVEFLCGDR